VRRLVAARINDQNKGLGNMLRKILIAGAAIGALSVAACGKPAETKTETTTVTEPAAPAPEAAPAPAATDPAATPAPAATDPAATAPPADTTTTTTEKTTTPP
jgi:hypothetical protein